MSQAELASMSKEQLIALVTQQSQSKVKFTVSEAGYINVQGLPGHNWKGFGATAEGWETLLSQLDPFRAYLAANKPLAIAKPIAEFGVRRRVPTLAPLREFVDAGALVSLGASLAAHRRRAAYYVD